MEQAQEGPWRRCAKTFVQHLWNGRSLLLQSRRSGILGGSRRHGGKCRQGRQCSMPLATCNFPEEALRTLLRLPASFVQWNPALEPKSSKTKNYRVGHAAIRSCHVSALQELLGVLGSLALGKRVLAAASSQGASQPPVAMIVTMPSLPSTRRNMMAWADLDSNCVGSTKVTGALSQEEEVSDAQRSPRKTLRHQLPQHGWRTIQCTAPF